MRGSAAGRGPVDEQRALGHDQLAGLQIADHLDQIAIGEAGFDLAQFNRLVLMRDPDPDLVALLKERRKELPALFSGVKAITSVRQSMRGLKCCNHGMPRIASYPSSGSTTNASESVYEPMTMRDDSTSEPDATLAPLAITMSLTADDAVTMR